MIRNLAPLLLLAGQNNAFPSLAFPSFGGRPTQLNNNGDVSRGSFADSLRQVTQEMQGFSRMQQGGLEVGRCASRESNQCCSGSDWNCQAPGSTCSCDQMCKEFNDCCSDYDDICMVRNLGAVCELREGPQQSPFGPEPAQIPEDHRVARASGDPHYHTFDGKTVHYQGGCIYRLTGLCDNAQNNVAGHPLNEFVVYGKNVQRFKEKARSNLIRPMAWVQTVIVEIPLRIEGEKVGRKFIMIDQDNKVRIANEYFADDYQSAEDIDASRLPFVLTDNTGARVGIIYERGNFVRVQIGSDGLTVGFNGKQNMRVHLPCQYNGNVCGLFGNSDNDPKNDNIMPDGTFAQTENQLGHSWVANDFPAAAALDHENCPEESNLGNLEPEEMCPADTLREAATHCKAILEPLGPFSACHDSLPPAEYFEDCVYDLCLFFENELDYTESMCEIYESYADECRENGVTGFSWRDYLTECTITCPANEVYYEELDIEQTCTETIAIASPGTFVAGCFCAEGHVRDNMGTCIAESDCPPLQNSQLFNPPQPSIKNDDGTPWQHEQVNLIDFNDLNPLNCLQEPIRALEPVKGGFSNHAPSNWIKPDACCDDKPYNTGLEGCCSGRHLYDFNDNSCVGGQIVSRL